MFNFDKKTRAGKFTCPFFWRGVCMEYICYCDKVTEEDIVRAIGQGARTIRDIQRMTGAMTHCDCANKNPKGT